MRLLAFIALAILPLSTASADTWTKEDYSYENTHTVPTVIEVGWYRDAVECALQPPNGLRVFVNADNLAFFELNERGEVHRIWGPWAQRVSIDYCAEEIARGT